MGGIIRKVCLISNPFIPKDSFVFLIDFRLLKGSVSGTTERKGDFDFEFFNVAFKSNNA